jgi:hypothetical protein
MVEFLPQRATHQKKPGRAAISPRQSVLRRTMALEKNIPGTAPLDCCGQPQWRAITKKS